MKSPALIAGENIDASGCLGLPGISPIIFLFILLELSCTRNPEKQSIYFTSDKIEINDKLKGILKHE